MSFSSTYTLNAVDNASPVIKNFAGSVTAATTTVTAETKKMSVSMKDVVGSVSAVATSAYGLYLSYDRVADMSVQVAKANLSVKTANEAVEDAQKRLNVAVEKYGEDSPQATEASKDLALAQERLTVNTERAAMVQENQHQAMVSFGLMVVPQVITLVGGLSKTMDMLKSSTILATVAQNAHTIASKAGAIATGIMTGAQALLNAVMNANPILLVVTALAALTAGLVWAYQNCEPFRNAVDWLAKTLGEGLAVAVKWVSDGLGWLWGRLQEGINWFLDLEIGGVKIKDMLTVLGIVVETLGTVFGAVFGKIGEIWNATIGRIIEGIGWLKGQLEGFWNWVTGQGAGTTGGENIPTFQHGGIVGQTGLALVHAGEAVVPSGVPLSEKIINNITVQNNVFTKSASVTGSEIVNALMGMGIPRFQRGGVMKETGLAILERGERILPGNAIPTQVTRNYKIDASSTVNINAPLVSIRGGGGGGGGMRDMMMAAKAVVFDALRSIRIQQTSSGALTSRVQTYSTSISTTPLATAGATAMVGSSAPTPPAMATTISSTATPSTATNMGSYSYNYETNPMPYNRIIPMPY